MKNTTVKGHFEIGPDSLEKLPDLIRESGQKALLIHGHRPVEDGLLTKVRLLLNKNGIEYADMGQILPNPKFSSVKRGIKIARKENCGLIIALGGGSTLQCAKGIALGLPYKGNVWDFWKGKKKPKSAAAVASIMTNPSSNAEFSDECTLVKKGSRKTVSYPQLVCSFAILDPKLAMYPFFPTMNQVFNLFMHLFNNGLTDDAAQREQICGLLKKLFAAVDTLCQDINNLDARSALFEIGAQSRKTFKAPKSICQKLGDEIAFKFSLTEGSACSALFTAWLDSFGDERKNQVIALANGTFGKDYTVFDSAARSFKEALKPLKLGLSLPESGLMVQDEDLFKIASTKEEKDILKKANRKHD